jgi:hypothetical protein
VTTGAAQSLGEPAAAADSAVSAVVATRFGSAGAQVRAWTRTARSGRWAGPGLVLPAGFGSSYDASAAASPGGPLLVVVGTAPAGEKKCAGGSVAIAGGSVAIVNVSSSGRLGPARLVSDQRGTGRFDDRPVVAIGPAGTVWVAWSEGPNADACQPVGAGDRLEVTVSHDGGRTFAPPVTMPAAGGGAAFGARLAPLGADRVAVSWTETMGNGNEAVLVSALGPGSQALQPQQVLTGAPLPLELPGASFYDFPAGDIAALPDGRLVVAVPFWRGGESVIGLAAGSPGGRWRPSALTPPAGADLLLPALGVLSSTSLRLLCAVHVRAGDRLGYDWADLRLSSPGYATLSAGLAPLTSAPAGPGFFELGEELSVTQTPAGILSSVVVAGSGGAALQAESWAVPRPVAPSASRPPSRTQTGASGSESGAAHSSSGWGWPGTGIAAGVICAGLLTAWAARRARRQRRYSKHRTPRHQSVR